MARTKTPSRISALLLILLLTFMCTACGGGDVDDDSADGRVTVNPPSCEASGACR